MKRAVITTKIQKIALGCIFLVHASLFAQCAEIVASDLALYRLLKIIRANVNDAELACGKDFSGAARFADEALVLLNQIVLGLNTEHFACNPEIGYLFVSMCNRLKGVDFGRIEPYLVRSQYRRINRFNEYVSSYCLSNKDLLSKDELDLFDKITKFNQLVMFFLLNEDYFDVGMIDTLVDVIRRPWEFISKPNFLTEAE